MRRQELTLRLIGADTTEIMNLVTRDAAVRLVETLRGVDLTTLAPNALGAILAESNADLEDFRDGIQFAERRYTRNLLYRNDDFELLLLCWAAGSTSPIHDHGGMRCAMKVLRGELVIDDYLILDGGERPGYAHIAPLATTIAGAGAVDVRTPSHDVHRVGAVAQPAISLHVYARPLENFLIFNERSRSCWMAASSYDSVPAQDR